MDEMSLAALRRFLVPVADGRAPLPGPGGAYAWPTPGPTAPGMPQIYSVPPQYRDRMDMDPARNWQDLNAVKPDAATTALVYRHLRQEDI